jgi:hypothetical protein
MIFAPVGNTSIYQALFEKDAARFVAGLVAPKTAHDIDQVLILSIDLPDIQAINELQEGAKEVSFNIDSGDEGDTLTRFNPLYLPTEKDISAEVELDSDGDVEAIAGFDNPFVAMTLKHSQPEFLNIIDASVVYNEFFLPPMHEALNNKTHAKHIH